MSIFFPSASSPESRSSFPSPSGPPPGLKMNFMILIHTSRIFVLNSKKVYTTPYSHQSSLMMYVFENYGYNFYSIMAFWENATFVFWLCQNSWFWVWKKNFSITIFHEKKLPFSVAPFILHLKHWNRAFEAFFVATKVHSATVPNGLL